MSKSTIAGDAEGAGLDPVAGAADVEQPSAAESDAPAAAEPAAEPVVADAAVEAPAEPAPAEVVLDATQRPKIEFPEPPVLDGHGPARVIALCNQKGGVGKTTSTINLGAALAEYGRRVLLVDFDPQGALSVGLGVNPNELDLTVYNLLMQRDVSIDEVLLKTGVPGLDLLPGNIDLSAAEVQLVSEVAREQTLARVLGPVLGEYDVILIDCQPSLGLLTVNALAAADGVIIPLECEYFALRGVALLMDTIYRVKERINPRLEVEGILATMYDSRTLHGREVLARVVDAFGDKVFHTVIARTVRFPETTVAGEPITTYASSSTGAAAYRQLAREVLAP
ncbi:MAG: ParA family protein [Candidatus Nanopelagicales bacterium]